MFSAKTEILGKPLLGWRLQLYTVIFEADTPAGRWFDKGLIHAAGVGFYADLHGGICGTAGMRAPPDEIRAELLWAD